MGAGDMETVGPSSSNELGSKTNGSLPPTVDPSLSAEEGLRFISTHLFICSGILQLPSLDRLSASSSSESVTTVPPVSRVKEEPENLVTRRNLNLKHSRGFYGVLLQVVWRQPLRVLHYAFIEAIITLGEWAR